MSRVSSRQRERDLRLDWSDSTCLIEKEGQIIPYWLCWGDAGHFSIYSWIVRVLGKMRKPAVIGQRFVTFCE